MEQDKKITQAAIDEIEEVKESSFGSDNPYLQAEFPRSKSMALKSEVNFD